MSGNRSIRDFFAPKTTQASAPPPSLPTYKTPSISSAPKSSNSQKPSVLASSHNSLASDPRDQRGHTPNLSPSPPSSRSPSPASSGLRNNVPSAPIQSTWSSSAVEIQNSDDEGGDSDSSLEDLASLLASKSSETKSRQPSNIPAKAPSTPVRSKNQKSKFDFHSSPLTVQPKIKYKFDLASLVSQAEKDEATEASSKRVKAMLAVQEEEEASIIANNGTLSPARFAHSELLDSVVAATDDDAHKVARALLRTEATITEKRWYFFDTQSKLVKSERRPFPSGAVSKEWRRELKDPKMRYQTFVSGFAEDMISLGQRLPDEIFLWILDEVCFEPTDPLRASYLNVLGESSDQANRLITVDVIHKIFRQIGGSPNATCVTEKIRLVQKLADPYAKKDWTPLLSVISLFRKISKQLTQVSRACVVCTLLRLCVDQLILENVHLLASVQETLCRLCRHTPDDEWESFCKDVCKTLFSCVENPSLRVSIVDCIPSTTPRTHNLRWRLATSFFFDDLSYSLGHSHNLADLEKFMDRLRSPAFHANHHTDWRGVAALINLLDVAIDDGRSPKIDMSDQENETMFNGYIDEICIMIKDIMKGVGATGAGFASRVKAKDALELVSQRIADTVRSKPKPREDWFDRRRGRQEENLDVERKVMASFVTKMERITNSVNSNGANDHHP